MTFTTLQFGATEKSLDDWGITAVKRKVSNQAKDNLSFEIPVVDITGAPPFPYDSLIIVRIQRVFANGSSGLQPGTCLPITGNKAWKGGQTFFVGWTKSPVAAGAGPNARLQYQALGVWERWIERTKLFQLFMSYDGSELIAHYTDNFVLGLSLNSLIGAQDTIAGTSATNLMSITQVLKQIADWAIYAGSLALGYAPFQFDDIAGTEDTGAWLLDTTPSEHCLLPDFIPNYGTSGSWDQGVVGQSSPNPANIASNLPASVQAAAGPNINLSLRAPLESINGALCAESLRRVAAWAGPIGDIVIWLDPTTASPGGTIANQSAGGDVAVPAAAAPLPTLNIASRDQLPAIDLPYPPLIPTGKPLAGPKGPMLAAVSDIRRCDELLPSCVALIFKLTGSFTVDGAAQPYQVLMYDITARIYGSGETYSTVPGTNGDEVGTVVEGIGVWGNLYTLATFATDSPAYVGGSQNSAMMQALQNAMLLPDAMQATIDYQGPSGSGETCTFTTIPVDTSSPAGGGSALAFWKYLFPKLADLTSPDFQAGSTVTAVDDNGDAIDLSTFQYLLTGNTVAPWMLSGNAVGGNGCQSVRAHITASLVGGENVVGIVSGTPTTLPTGQIEQQNIHATPTLVTLPGGTYVRSSITEGEIVPYGLSGFIFNLCAIPHFEGTYTIQEDEITDQCPMGNNLNLTGSQAQWADMAACVQSIDYDLDAGRTTLTFGPGRHLGLKDLADRLKANRHPRWSFLTGTNIGNNPAKNGGTQLGSDVAGKSPHDGPASRNLQIFPANPNDAAANSAAYQTAGSGVGTPGVTIDNRASGQPNYGNISGLSAPTAPTLLLAAGSAGSLSACIRLSISDLVGANKQAYFQPVLICVDVDGTPTPKVMYVLATNPETS